MQGHGHQELSFQFSFWNVVVMGATESHIVEFQKGAAKISVDVPALPGHPPLKTSYISVKV